MPDTDASRETVDPTPSAAGGVGDDVESVAKTDTDSGSNLQTSNPETVDSRVTGDHCPIHVGEVSVTSCVGGTSVGSIEEGPLVSVDPSHITADHATELLPGSGSRFPSKPNQAGKAIGRQKGRKQRKAGSVKLPENRSLPSQPVTPFDSFADQSSEENDYRSSTNDQANRTLADIHDSSAARRQSQRADGERFQGTPSRQAFAPILASELNRRKGVPPSQTPEKVIPSKSLATSNSFMPIQVTSTTSVDEELVSPILSLQRAGSITDQVLTTGVGSDPESDSIEEKFSVSAITHYDEEETIEAALERQSVLLYGHSDSSEHHDSDKENVPANERPVPVSIGMTWNSPQSFNTPRSCAREPLRTLYSAPSPSIYQSPDIFATPISTSQNLARFPMGAGRRWLMVVDTNCLLNAESLESLKVLVGIRETRLVIPNIVVRELDFLQKQDDCMARASSGLQWIEACMLTMPSWIHVQSSGETVHVAMTPPVSPSLYRGLHSFVSESAMMHPTLHDHVLECALFQQTIPGGRVAILTDDTTLKIKGLAESLVVETAVNFSHSLLNPYSNRFVYMGSTPIGRSSINRVHENLYDGLGTPGTTSSGSKWTTPTSRPDTPRPTSRANFSLWRKSQPLGLQALLQ